MELQQSRCSGQLVPAPLRFARSVNLGVLVVLAIVAGVAVCAFSLSARERTSAMSIGTSHGVVSLGSKCILTGDACHAGETVCCSGDERCYSKNEFEAYCKETCHKIDKDGYGWSCMIVVVDGYQEAPTEPPAPPPGAAAAPAGPIPGAECAWEGEDCTPSHCCKRQGFKCFEQQPGKWASCSDNCETLKSFEASGGGWTCAELGGDQELLMVPQAAAGQEAGTSMFCFIVVTPAGVTAPGVKEGYETQLWELMDSKKVGICACEGYKKYEGVRVDKGDWQSVVNTDIFVQVWQQVKGDGMYAQHDWTVKVDADAVFFPDRLKAHLTGLRAPANTPVYLHNIDFKFKFQGALEVLSRQAVDVFLDNVGLCGDHLGHNGGEDFFTMQCLDATKVGYMEDFKLLDDKYTHDAGWKLDDVDFCQDPAITTFHPYKSDYAWWGCYQVAMGMKQTGDFVSCDKRWPGDACSLSSSKAH